MQHPIYHLDFSVLHYLKFIDVAVRQNRLSLCQDLAFRRNLLSHLLSLRRSRPFPFAGSAASTAIVSR